jgi:hypothetical protein
MKQPEHRWRQSISNILVEISLHSIGEPYTPGGQGIYCYYIFISEQKTPPDLFKSLWLEDKIVQIAPNCPRRITHDYYSLPLLNSVDFHVGITFYAKHGHTEGFRSVKLGCDYNHLWDTEDPPTFDQVLYDATNTAKQLDEYIKSYETQTAES